jgi:hypothetical protein
MSAAIVTNFANFIGRECTLRFCLEMNNLLRQARDQFRNSLHD